MALIDDIREAEECAARLYELNKRIGEAIAAAFVKHGYPTVASVGDYDEGLEWCNIQISSLHRGNEAWLDDILEDLLQERGMQLGYFTIVMEPPFGITAAQAEEIRAILREALDGEAGADA